MLDVGFKAKYPPQWEELISQKRFVVNYPINIKPVVDKITASLAAFMGLVSYAACLYGFGILDSYFFSTCLSFNISNSQALSHGHAVACEEGLSKIKVMLTLLLVPAVIASMLCYKARPIVNKLAEAFMETHVSREYCIARVMVHTEFGNRNHMEERILQL